MDGWIALHYRYACNHKYVALMPQAPAPLLQANGACKGMCQRCVLRQRKAPPGGVYDFASAAAGALSRSLSLARRSFSGGCCGGTSAGGGASQSLRMHVWHARRHVAGGK